MYIRSPQQRANPQRRGTTCTEMESDCWYSPPGGSSMASTSDPLLQGGLRNHQSAGVTAAVSCRIIRQLSPAAFSHVAVHRSILLRRDVSSCNPPLDDVVHPEGAHVIHRRRLGADRATSSSRQLRADGLGVWRVSRFVRQGLSSFRLLLWDIACVAAFVRPLQNDCLYTKE